MFLGTPEFAVASLDALLASRHEIVAVVAQPDRPSGRGMKLQKPPVAQLALDRGLPLLQPPKLDAAVVEHARALAPDLGVVVAYGRILRPSFLAVPRLGFINVHGSLLPKYRGAAPIQRAIENGEAETGVAIMQVDEQLDHGPVFAMRSTPIGADERAPQLFERLARIGGELLVEVVDQLEAGTARATEQDHDRATYAAKIEKEEGRVDWTMPASRLYDRFRAFFPWPGLFIHRGDEIVKLTEVRESDLARRGVPGEVLEVNRESIVVACGEGALEIVQMQRPGKKAAAASDVARGLGFAAGTRLT